MSGYSAETERMLSDATRDILRRSRQYRDDAEREASLQKLVRTYLELAFAYGKIDSASTIGQVAEAVFND